MNKKDHKKRHKELHKALDELMSDFMGHTRKLISETSLKELMHWSYEQTKNPTEEE